MNSEQHVEQRNFLIELIKYIFKPLFDGYLPSFLPMTSNVRESVHRFKDNNKSSNKA